MLLWGIIMVSPSPPLYMCVVDAPLRLSKVSCETTGSFSVRFILSIACHVRDIPFRRKVAPGNVRGGAVSRGELLPLMVRSNHLLTLKLIPRLVGTNVRNSASARLFSSLPPRYQVHSVACLLYVDSVPSREFYLLDLPKGRNLKDGRGRWETWLGMDFYFGRSRNGRGGVPLLLDHPGLPRQRKVPQRR